MHFEYTFSSCSKYLGFNSFGYPAIQLKCIKRVCLRLLVAVCFHIFGCNSIKVPIEDVATASTTLGVLSNPWNTSCRSLPQTSALHTYINSVYACCKNLGGVLCVPLTQHDVFFSTSTIKLFAGEGMFGTGDWTFALVKLTFCTFAAGENAFVVDECDVFHVWC